MEPGPGMLQAMLQLNNNLLMEGVGTEKGVIWLQYPWP